MSDTMSDDLFTIAVALGCHNEATPKAVMNRVLQAICDYQSLRRHVISLDEIRHFSGYGSEQCKKAFDVVVKIAHAHPSHQESA